MASTERQRMALERLMTTVPIGNHLTLSFKPGESGFIRHTDRFMVMQSLLAAKSDYTTMMKIRHAIPGPVSHLSDDDVLGLIATEIGRGRMVLTDDFLDQPRKQSITASGSGMTTTIYHSDGSTEIRTGNRPWRNYNPGDIEVFPRDKDPFAMRHGAIGVEGGFAIFPDEETGFAALTALLENPKYQSRTILETMKAFAPASDRNDPAGYADMLSSAVKAPVSTRLSMLSAVQLKSLVLKIAQVEGYYHAGTVKIVPSKKGAR